MIRTLVVDDEEPARYRLEHLVRHHSSLHLVATATSGSGAQEVLAREVVDLILLDIEMPEMSGIELVESLSSGKLPLFVFVTAHTQHAVDAFEKNAIDYLLKPFSDQRFDMAVRRAIRRRDDRERRQVVQKLRDALAEAGRDQARENLATRQIGIRLAGTIYFVDASDIQYVDAAGNYLEIKAAERKHLLRETLTRLEKRLPNSDFVRIHRSTLVNRHFVAELSAVGGGDYEIRMTDNAIRRVSRTYRKKVFEKLGV